MHFGPMPTLSATMRPMNSSSPPGVISSLADAVGAAGAGPLSPREDSTSSAEEKNGGLQSVKVVCDVRYPSSDESAGGGRMEMVVIPFAATVASACCSEVGSSSEAVTSTP